MKDAIGFWPSSFHWRPPVLTGYLPLDLRHAGWGRSPIGGRRQHFFFFLRQGFWVTSCILAEWLDARVSTWGIGRQWSYERFPKLVSTRGRKMNIHESLSCLLLSLAEAKLHTSSSCSRKREEGKNEVRWWVLWAAVWQGIHDFEELWLSHVHELQLFLFGGLWELDLVLAFVWDLPLLLVGCFSLA